MSIYWTFALVCLIFFMPFCPRRFREKYGGVTWILLLTFIGIGIPLIRALTSETMPQGYALFVETALIMFTCVLFAIPAVLIVLCFYFRVQKRAQEKIAYAEFKKILASRVAVHV